MTPVVVSHSIIARNFLEGFLVNETRSRGLIKRRGQNKRVRTTSSKLVPVGFIQDTLTLFLKGVQGRATFVSLVLDHLATLEAYDWLTERRARAPRLTRSAGECRPSTGQPFLSEISRKINFDNEELTVVVGERRTGEPGIGGARGGRRGRDRVLERRLHGSGSMGRRVGRRRAERDAHWRRRRRQGLVEGGETH